MIDVGGREKLVEDVELSLVPHLLEVSTHDSFIPLDCGNLINGGGTSRSRKGTSRDCRKRDTAYSQECISTPDQHGRTSLGRRTKDCTERRSPISDRPADISAVAVCS